MKAKKTKKTKSSSKPQVPDSRFINTKLHIFIIFSFAVVLYANTLVNDYTQDDAIVITDNMFTKQGFKGIPGLLLNDTFYGFFKKRGKAKLVSGGRYRPFTPVTFAIEWQFFGHNPMISHLINILLYGLLGIILYKFLLLLFQEFKSQKLKYWLAFFSTLIFIAHPVHTEAVANIKGRDEIVTLLFSLFAVIFIIKWFKTGINKYWIYTFVLFLLALFSKENAITFLAVVPLAFYLFISEKKKSYINILLPFLISTLVFLSVRTYILGLDFGGNSNELMNNPFLKISGNKFIPFAFSEKFATIIFTLGKYIQLLIFPHPLTNDYYPRQIDIMTFANWKVLLSLLFYIVIIVFAVKNLKKNKIISFGILFYIITLSIVSNIVFPVGTNMSERFIFMPSLGFSLIVGYLLYLLYEKKKNLAFGIIALILVLFTIKTVSRNTVWKNDFTLFTTDVKVSSNSAKALNAAGGSLIDAAFYEKNESKKRKMVTEAKKYLLKALKIHPNYKNAILLLGNADYFLNDFEEAIEMYKKVLILDPKNDEVKKNMAITYRDAGKYYGEKKNDLKKAIEYLEQAKKMRPQDYETIRLLGVANAMSGNKVKAIELFLKAVKLNPDNAGAYMNLGNAYYNIGDQENGKKYHKKALELDPDIFNKNK